MNLSGKITAATCYKNISGESLALKLINIVTEKYSQSPFLNI